MEIKIGSFQVSNNSKPFIIAEAGINHNGDINKAYEMIKVAKKAGVDCIKFQTFKAEEFVSDPAQTYTYRSNDKDITESMLEMFKRYEFSKQEWKMIKSKCDEEKILFLSTPQNYPDLELLLELGVSAIKVGSDDFVNIPLLKKYASTGLPLILSCGMSDLSEIKDSLKAVGFLNGYPAILLLCTSEYPTPPSDVNLLKLRTLAEEFPKLVLGLSDHTQGDLASSVAVGMGAVVFEKHFTLDNKLEGPDHWFSENPEGLAKWVRSIKTAYEMLGSSVLNPTEKEKEMRKIARRSVVALVDIKKGDVFSIDNVGLKRPGNGIPPKDFDMVVGKRASRVISRGELLKREDIE